MSLTDGLIVVLMVGFVGLMVWGLQSRFHAERALQAPGKRSPVWHVVLAAVVVVAVLGLGGSYGGWSTAAIVRLALVGVVIVSLVQRVR